MHDEFGDDADFAAVVDEVERNAPARSSSTTNANGPKIQQPKPQILPNRAAPSSILVSTRQKGNPSLNYIRSLPWEYSDIPADYLLGATTCALFLSLKYHRLHPEYIYSRIRVLGHKYNLRVLLTMVDIQNHEESLKELSKTSLVNNLTLILCWSAQEAGRYLELYKSYEHASPTSIRAHQATSYSEKLVEFITVPRSINKTDAVSLVSAFGSLRAAVNARPEEIGEITGWGEKKVQRWCGTVRENFRVRKAAKRKAGLAREGSSIGLPRGESSMGVEREDSLFDEEEDDSRPVSLPVSFKNVPTNEASASRPATAEHSPPRPTKRTADEVPLWQPGEDEEEALLLAAAEEEETVQDNGSIANINAKANAEAKAKAMAAPTKMVGKAPEGLNEGVAAALAKLRKQ
ncbi:ssDNA endonuclease and repair protein rad10 [Mycoblastus sanguinarius]|nr:ssDNA endonuclease and repair protein rad10 [Mycoblastus sanguinarius]